MPQKTLDAARKIVIYLDTREAGTKVADILRNRCTAREKQLAAGDYLLSERVCAERKTTQDFVQSIVDGRLFKQAAELREAYETPLLIIEGNALFDTGINVHPNAVRGALASIATEFMIPVIWTENQYETAEMLFTIAKREQLVMKKGVRLRTKRRFRSMNEQQLFLVAGLPDIGDTTAKNLLKHFGSPARVFAATETELRTVEGIGEKTAKRLRRILVRKYEKSILED